MVDQSPLARTPRSTPAVFIGAFDHIRALFAETDDAQGARHHARLLQLQQRRGPMRALLGNGFEKIEMQFLSDLYVTCPECEGKRYQPHALKLTLHGKNIHEVLGMTVEDAAEFFAKHAVDMSPPSKRKAQHIVDATEARR